MQPDNDSSIILNMQRISELYWDNCNPVNPSQKLLLDDYKRDILNICTSVCGPGISNLVKYLMYDLKIVDLIDSYDDYNYNQKLFVREFIRCFYKSYNDFEDDEDGFLNEDIFLLS